MTARGIPTLQGKFGKAWLCERTGEGAPKDWDANIVQWQLNVPKAHPFWEWWLIACVSLRDIPGVKPATKKYPEAEFELMIVALNPDLPIPDPDEPATGRRYQFLTPFDVIHQFHGVTDAQALELVTGCVRMIVERGMSPDQDYRKLWASLINNTIEHIVTGGHPKHHA